MPTDEMERSDEGASEREDPEAKPRGFAAEVLDALRGGWRAVVLAILGTALGLLVAKAFDWSDDATTIGALLGAGIAASLKALADKFDWRDRTLTAVAGLFGFLNLEKPRSVFLGSVGSAGSSATSAISTGALVASTAIIAVSGAAITLGTTRVVGPADSGQPHPLAGQWKTTAFVSRNAGGGPGPDEETWEIARRCRDSGCAYELAATTSWNIRVPAEDPVVREIGDGRFVQVRSHGVLVCTGRGVRPVRRERPGDPLRCRGPPRTIASS